MSTNLTVTGQRLEPRIDGVVEWSRGEIGELELGLDSAMFKDWLIPYVAIDDAVLNTERLLLKKVQCLAIEAETGRYMFILHKPIEPAHEFPFPVRITERRSAYGKLLLFASVLFLLKVAFDVFMR